MQGELALAFGDLLRKLWSSGRTAIAPRAFKSKLARFAPQFSGYNQHDSQVSLCKIVKVPNFEIVVKLINSSAVIIITQYQNIVSLCNI